MPQIARRIFWLIALIVAIGHLMMLIAATVGTWEYPGPLNPNAVIVPPLTRAAFWITEPNWLFVALNAALDLPIIAALWLSGRDRTASRLFAVSVIIRLLLAGVSVAATIYLASLGRIQTESTAFGGTWRSLQMEDAIEQIGFHLVLAIPLFVYALRWLPFLIPGYRRRLIWAKTGCCLNCGYDLRAASNSMCPECGASSEAVGQALTAVSR